MAKIDKNYRKGFLQFSFSKSMYFRSGKNRTKIYAINNFNNVFNKNYSLQNVTNLYINFNIDL